MISKHLATGWLAMLLLALSSCGSESTNTQVPEMPDGDGTSQPPKVINNSPLNEYKIIIYGNSHSAELGDLLETIFAGQLPGTVVNTMSVHGRFLDEIVAVSGNVDKLRSENWSHAIFQGQKYSQSGTTEYPTTAAERLILTAKNQKITPVLFPEHPQEGNPAEAQRVYDLHLSISARQPSCVAPVGMVWNRLSEILPGTNLYSSDGNHASYAGNVLTAMTFYQIISSELADTMSFDPAIELTQHEQALFGQIVTEVLALYPACGEE